MRKITISFTVAMLLNFALLAACSSSSPTSGTPWQQDCGAFVQTLAELATKAKGDNTSGLGDQFENKEVIWNLNFKEIKQDAKTGDTLLFDLEPFGIQYKFFSGKPVMMGFKPAAGTSETWKTITPGSQVKISAIVSRVSFMTMTPGDNPTKQGSAVMVSLENVKRVGN